jgi:beta-fructofuranosidase
VQGATRLGSLRRFGATGFRKSRAEIRVLEEDPFFEKAQLRAGIDAELFSQHGAGPLICTQRIGLATSTDLIHWDKHPDNPLLEADPRFYEQLDLNLWFDQAWRDPWLFQHPQTGEFHAYITARCNYGPADGRGVIAHARSTDLLNWEVLPPVTAPGDFGQLEVPQLVSIQNRYYMLFCTADSTHAADYQRKTGVEPVRGTHYLVADDPLGPFRFSTREFLVGDPIGSFYNGKLVQGPDDAWYFMASRQSTSGGDFIGTLSDPMPVTIEDDGDLSVSWQEFL